ncbi:hypothetical protein FFF34_006035 [Inquilinus sp. KBS0705]|nr:hypothetical protein FFF34_006035 [Inquilinus sp. KBS0705]
MTKVILSSKLILDKIILIVITLIVVVAWITMPIIPIVFFLLAFVLITNSFYSLFWYTNKVTYSNDRLYIGSKAEKEVLFENINLIAVTPHYGTYRTMWKINYLSEDKEKSVYFYPRITLLNMDEFILTVKQIKPEVMIRSYTLSLDIDL